MTATNSIRLPEELDHAQALERCAICGRQPAASTVSAPTTEHPDDIHVAQQRWHLCAPCAEEVWREVDRAALDTPLRIPIAVALVASARSPLAHPPIWTARYWERLDAAAEDRWMTRAITLFFLWPIVIFLGVVVLSIALR